MGWAPNPPLCLCFEVRHHQFGQVRDVGPAEPVEQIPAALRVELADGQRVKAGVLDALEVPVPREGGLDEPGSGDKLRVEGRGIIGPPVGGFALMIKPEVEGLPDVFKGFLGVLLVLQEGLPVQDLVDLGRVPFPLDPVFQQVVDFGVVAGMLGVEATVEIILGGSRDELLQRLGPVLGQREIFDEADFLGICVGGGDEEPAADNEDGDEFHGGLLWLLFDVNCLNRDGRD